MSSQPMSETQETSCFVCGTSHDPSAQHACRASLRKQLTQHQKAVRRLRRFGKAANQVVCYAQEFRRVFRETGAAPAVNSGEWRGLMEALKKAESAWPGDDALLDDGAAEGTPR